MQAIHDIFHLFGTTSAMAEALDEKQDTVYRWKKFGRIPQTAWDKLIEACKARGKRLTAADLHRLNKPMKQRGRPAHKIQHGVSA